MRNLISSRLIQNISQEIKPVLKSENTAITHKPEQVLLKKSFQKDTDYIELDEYPEFPANKEPSKADCVGYTYMSMVQLCNLSKRLGKSRGFAYNAFGGDRGKYKVDPDRMTRAYLKGGYRPWKFVLISAVEEFFKEEGLGWK